jgi:hypothetical protein
MSNKIVKSSGGGIVKYDVNKPERMKAMSVVLKKHIVSNKLFTPIRQKNYVHVEGWQFAGGLMGLYPRVVKVENVSTGQDIKWLAEVEIVNIKTNDVVSRGFAICSKKESKKSSFDEYAILSMAQTRAIGKAYRNLIGWVMKLAGYETTPSEEMTKVGQDPEPVKTKAPIIEAECHSCGNPMTKAEATYSKKIFKKQLCRDCQKTAKEK